MSLHEAVSERIASTAPADFRGSQPGGGWARVPITGCWVPMFEPRYKHDDEWGDCWRVYRMPGKEAVVPPKPTSYEGTRHATRLRRLQRLLLPNHEAEREGGG